MVALCVVTASTALGIGYIHREQTEERKKLHEGCFRSGTTDRKAQLGPMAVTRRVAVKRPKIVR